MTRFNGSTITLKALCAADFHSSEQAIEFLKQAVDKEKPDLVLLAGDVTHAASSADALDYAKRAIAIARAGGAECFAVHGNTDSLQVKLFFEKEGVSIHNKKLVWNEIEFVGYGGSAPTPFASATTYSEAQIYSDLSKLVTKQSVLVTHSPPHALPFELDKTFDLHAVGSKSVRKIIDERRPRACVCAHVHERSGEANVLGCKIVKIAPIKDGRYAALDLDSASSAVRAEFR